MIEPARDGWLASGHVARIIPNESSDAGWLFAAFSTEIVQVQVRALACGSLVDALYENDLRGVVLPPQLSGFDGAAVVGAWEKFSVAADAEQAARDLIEAELAAITGEEQRFA